MNSSNVRSTKAWAGVMFLLTSATLQSVSHEFVTLSSKNGIPGLQMLFLNRISLLILVLAAWPIFTPQLPRLSCKQITLLILITITHNIELGLTFISMTYAVPGVATSIRQGSETILTACIGYIFLKEVLACSDFFGMFLNFVGVVAIGCEVMMLGEGNIISLNVLTFLLPLLAAVVRAPLNVSDKFLIDIQDIHILIFLFGMASSGVMLLPGLIYALETPVWKMSWQTTCYLIGLNVAYVFSLLLFYCGLLLEKSGVSAAVEVIGVPITILLDYFVLSKVPSMLKIAGGSLVFVGSMAVGVFTVWRHRQKEKRTKLLNELDFDVPPDDR